MVDFERGNDSRCATLAGKEARIQAVCTKAIKSFWGYCMYGKKLECQYRYRWCCIPAQKKRCDPYLSTKLEDAQLHCYLESCHCFSYYYCLRNSPARRSSATCVCPHFRRRSFIKLRRNQDLPSLQQHLFGPVEFSFGPRRDNKLVPSELKLVQMHPFAWKKGIFQRARLALARR